MYTKTCCLVQPEENWLNVSIGEIQLKYSLGKELQFFCKERPTARLKVKTNNPNEHIAVAVEHVQKLGYREEMDFAYDKDSSFNTVEPNHREIIMGESALISPPLIADTRGIGTCLGLGIYNPKTSEGSLHHIAGSENISVKTLANILISEIHRLGNGLNVYFASGLGTIDNECLSEIYKARVKVDELLKHESIAPKINLSKTLCERVGEIIDFFSLDSKTGIFTVQKKIVPYENLLNMDIMHLRERLKLS